MIHSRARLGASARQISDCGASRSLSNVYCDAGARWGLIIQYLVFTLDWDPRARTAMNALSTSSALVFFGAMEEVSNAN